MSANIASGRAQHGYNSCVRRAVHSLLVAVVLLGLLATGCKDEANPVLPPVDTEPPGLSGAGAGADAALAVRDTAVDRIPDLAVEAPPPDGRQIACSLLKQDCSTDQLPLQACYPVGTLGRCLVAGSAPPLVGCTAVNDCEKGTVCVPDVQTGMGVCFSLCNRSDTSTCGKNNTCVELHGFSDVGYCLQT
jgi:hypothetical protein